MSDVEPRICIATLAKQYRKNFLDNQSIELPYLGEQADAENVAALAEIAENLHRRELPALERDSLRAEWVRLREATTHLGECLNLKAGVLAPSILLSRGNKRR